MSPSSQLFIITALSGLGFLFSTWCTPRVHDPLSLSFIWVPWFTVTSLAMLLNGQASPLVALACVLWFIPIFVLALRSESLRFRSFLVIFWVITSIALLNSKLYYSSVTPPEPTRETESDNTLHPSFQPPADIKPTNHLSLGRKEGDIKGSFVIDTGLYVTNYRYSAVSTKIPQAERNNIALRSHSGSIDVDLWLMPRPRESCVKIKIGAKAGITARLHTANKSRPAMSVSSTHGANAPAELHLPRTFEGFLYINNEPRPTMSDEVLCRSTVLVDTDEEKMFFIGDFHHIEYSWHGDDRWHGDNIQATGRVHFQYLESDEASSSPDATI